MPGHATRLMACFWGILLGDIPARSRPSKEGETAVLGPMTEAVKKN